VTTESHLPHQKQSAAARPDPTLQRKAAIAYGAALDHRGEVLVAPIPNFDLNRTIFNTLEGRVPRFVMRTRIAKEPHWSEKAAHEISAAYAKANPGAVLPEIDPTLLRFLIDECDFDVEHADGSFLDHLYFGFEYSALHYPERSPLVMLLHSILGTGTNTFAMPKEKIPALKARLSDFDWRHVEAFPSVLRVLYDLPLREELRANLSRLDGLESIRLHRVIDNEPITLSAEDFFVQLNYQLIHLVDFLPVSNWRLHSNDTSFILFRDLYDLMERAGKRVAKIDYTPSRGRGSLRSEASGLGGLFTALIPDGLSEKMAARSVRTFSERIGHSMDYQLVWRT
jgi:hypothetical protein